MVEITTKEQNKGKRMKKVEDSLRDLWDNIKHINIPITGVLEEEPKKRYKKKKLREYSWKFPQHGKGNSQSSPRSAKSPIQDKLKEKHTETHINETTKIKYKEKILKPSREKKQITYKGTPIRLSADFSAVTASQKEVSRYI